ncbi:MAG: sensor histidine kinase [Bacteroidales bacterium]
MKSMERNAEEELRSSEIRYRTLFESAKDAIFLMADGLFIDCNSATLEMYGCRREEIIGETPGRFSPPIQPDGRSSDEKSRERIALALAGTPQSFEWRHCQLNGTEFDAEVSLNRLELKAKPYLQAIVRDITERKLSEKKLQASEEKFRKSFASHPGLAGISTLADGTYLDVNQNFCTILGWRREEVIGNTSLDLGIFFDPSQRVEIVNLLKNGGKIHNLEVRVKTKTGDIRSGLFSSEIIETEGQDCLLSQFIDITDRKLAEAQIRTMNDQLEQRVQERTAQLEASNKELDAFCYSVSHDLRAPVRALNSFAKILFEDYNQVLDDEGHRLLTVIAGNAKKMGNLIDDLLEFSHLGRQDIMVSHIDMEAMAQSVYEDLCTSTACGKIKFNLLPLPTCMGDPKMARQAWINLLSNAIKFSSQKPEPVITVGSKLHAGDHVYFVKDNGTGFDMAYYPKLFGVFQRLHSEKEFEGSGVGLAIVQRIIQRMHGRIWAEGAIGEGATFYFTLPRTLGS